MLENNLVVSTPSANYSIYFEKDFNKLNTYMEENNLSNRKVCVITDSNVEKLYLEDVVTNLRKVSLEVLSFSFPAGEESKNLDIAREIYTFLLENHFDRKAVILALGGGVVGDMAGFVAATYMRGVSFVQIPTTLLSQVDSSVGGKVGVDFMNNKNLIGAFYQPKFVYMNLNTLKTLDKVQFSSGMGEVIKHGLIVDEDYFNYILENDKAIKELDFDAIFHVVYGSCKIKSKIVGEDEKEEGKRELLNYGHTFGHAIETLSNFTLPHGFCVATGILCSGYYSLKENLISRDEYIKIAKSIYLYGLKSDIKEFSTDDIIKQMYLDKKTKNNQLSIIILKDIGHSESKIFTDDQILKECINFVKKS